MKPTAEGVNFGPEACSGVSDLSTFEARLKVISGAKAEACRPDNFDSGMTSATNRCVTKAVKQGHAFFAYYVLGGSRVWNVAVGIAADGKGNLFTLSFDNTGSAHAGLAGGFQTFDNGATVVVPCPHPIELRQTLSGTLTCVRQRGNLLISPK
jgi:hypothetical protein